MKKAIILYSKTGNTRAVAERLNTVFQGDVMEIRAASDDPNVTDVTLTEIPDHQAYDFVIFASPVHAFRLCNITKAYLSQVKDLHGKTIHLFVTHFFPYAWMGANQTLRQMRKMIEKRGGTVSKTHAIHWSSKHRETLIEQMITSYKTSDI